MAPMLLLRRVRWLGHVIGMPMNRLSHRVPYGPLGQFHRSVGGEEMRFKDHIKSIHKKCNIPFNRMEALASNRAVWQSILDFGMSFFDAEYDRAAALRCSCRHQQDAVLRPLQDSAHQCPNCDRQCYSRIGLFSRTKSRIQR